MLLWSTQKCVPGIFLGYCGCGTGHRGKTTSAVESRYEATASEDVTVVNTFVCVCVYIYIYIYINSEMLRAVTRCSEESNISCHQFTAHQ
jgi:hypothetical protein